jgi:hypothetical protein
MTKRFVLAAAMTLCVALAATPASSDVEGRWKLDGSGGCFFDPNDTGPDQCTPDDPDTPNPPDDGPGRWKVDGNGGCVFDPDDDGPDQCTPSGDPDDPDDPNDPDDPDVPDTPGRWKIDGDACVFDPTDEGPDQCTPASTR